LSSDISQVSVRWAGDQVFLGSDPIGHSVVFDSSVEGPGAGIGPMKALLCALGACSGMDIVAIMRKRKQKLTSLRIEIEGRRPASGQPRPFSEIEVKYRLAGKRLERRLVEEAVGDSIKKYCSVAATVSGKARIAYSFEMLED
jgi:putative redox protein